MPKIPTYEGHVPLKGGSTGVPGSLAVAGQVGEAVAGLGRAIGGVGNVAIQLAREWQKEEDETYINAKVNAFEKKAINLGDSELSKYGGDAIGGSARLSKQFDDLIKKEIENEDPRYANELTGRYKVKRNHRFNQVRAHERAQVRVWQQQTDKEVIATYGKDAFNHPEELPTYLGWAKNALGERYTGQNRSDIIAAGVDGMILQDPAAAKAYFAEVRDSMTVDHQRKYEKKIDDTLKAAEKQTKEDIKKTKELHETIKQKDVDDFVREAAMLAGRGELTWTWIEKRAPEWVDGEKLKQVQGWIGKARTSTTNDKKTLADINEKIATDPKSIKGYDYFGKFVTKGLLTPPTAWSKFEEWESRMKDPKPQKDGRLSYGMSYYKGMFTAGTFTPSEDEIKDAKEAEQAALGRLLEKQLAFRTFLEETPNATDTDVERFIEKEMRPYLEKQAVEQVGGIGKWLKDVGKFGVFGSAILQAEELKTAEGEAEGEEIAPEVPQKQIMRIGKEKGTGRKVIQYTDGTTDYAD